MKHKLFVVLIIIYWTRPSSIILKFFILDQIVFVQGAAATPVELLRGLTEYGVRSNVKNVRLCHMHLEGAAPFAKKENASKLK